MPCNSMLHARGSAARRRSLWWPLDRIFAEGQVGERVMGGSRMEESGNEEARRMCAADFIARLITDTMAVHSISLIRMCVGMTPSTRIYPRRIDSKPDSCGHAGCSRHDVRWGLLHHVPRLMKSAVRSRQALPRRRSRDTFTRRCS